MSGHDDNKRVEGPLGWSEIRSAPEIGRREGEAMGKGKKEHLKADNKVIELQGLLACAFQSANKNQELHQHALPKREEDQTLDAEKLWYWTNRKKRILKHTETDEETVTMKEFRRATWWVM